MCASVGEKFAEVVYWMKSEACGFGAGINCRVYPRSAAMCVFALAALLQLAGYHSNSAGFITCSRPEAIQSSFPSLVLNVTMLLDILTINLTNLMRGYQSGWSLAVVVWRVTLEVKLISAIWWSCNLLQQPEIFIYSRSTLPQQTK